MEENATLYSDIPCNADFRNFNDDDDKDEADRTEQTLDFDVVPPFVLLFRGSPKAYFIS